MIFQIYNKTKLLIHATLKHLKCFSKKSRRLSNESNNSIGYELALSPSQFDVNNSKIDKCKTMDDDCCEKDKNGPNDLNSMNQRNVDMTNVNKNVDFSSRDNDDNDRYITY